jgi:hypothetical protein
MVEKQTRRRGETRGDKDGRPQLRLWPGVACPSWQRQSIFGIVYDARRGFIPLSSSRAAAHSLMAKRRAIIDSDDEQDDNQPSPSSHKRSRLDDKDQTKHRSSKSKGKGKAREDNDILNDIRVDDDDDITAIRDTRAEEDEGSQERFEEEHEESIRESIRQRNKQQGVRSSLCPIPIRL